MPSPETQKLLADARALRERSEVSEQNHKRFLKEIQAPLSTLREIGKATQKAR